MREDSKMDSEKSVPIDKQIDRNYSLVAVKIPHTLNVSQVKTQNKVSQEHTTDCTRR